MSVVIVNAPLLPNNPAILYNNAFKNSTVTPSSEESEFDADNIVSGLTYNFWKPVTLPAICEFDNAAPTNVDACGIAAHNLWTNLCVVIIEYFDGTNWQQIASHTPVDNSAILFLFDSVRTEKVRIRVDGDAAPSIGVVYWGSRLTVEQRVYGGHTPVIFNQKNTIRPLRSEGGQWLGRSVVRRAAEISLDFNQTTAAWMRANYKPFVDSVVTDPFFVSWRPTQYPQEIAYAWTAQDLSASNNGQADRMQSTLSAVCYELNIEPFEPSDVSDLTVWLDASQESTINFDSSNRVSGWLDNSGYSHDASQLTATNQPLYVPSAINSKGAIDFSPIDEGMEISTTDEISDIWDNGATLKVVINANDDGGFGAGRIVAKNSWQVLTVQESNNFIQLQFDITTSGTSGQWITAGRFVIESRSVIIELSYDSSNLATPPVIKIDGQLCAVTTNSTPTGDYVSDSGDNLYVGNLAALNRGFDGYIADLYLYKKILTSSDSGKLCQYLANKWDISIDSPLDLSPFAWYDASDSDTVIESSGAVSQWSDKSGNNYHMIQGAGANQPTTNLTTINSLNVIDFTTDDFVANGSINSFLSGTVAFTTFAVFKLDVNDANPKTIIASSVDSNDRTITQIDNQRLTTGTFNGAVWEFNDIAFTDTTNAHIISSLNSNANSISAFLDATEITDTVETPASSDTATTTIGSRTNGASFFEGSIAEILFFERELSTTQRKKVEAYLAAKWGVVI